MRRGALLSAILKGGKANTVQRHVGISRVGVEALANHQYSLAVRISPLFRKGNVGRQGNVAGDFLPGELKGVGGKPHVLAAAAHQVGAVLRIKLNRAGMQNRTHVGMVLKDARRGLAGLSKGGGDANQHGQNS